MQQDLNVAEKQNCTPRRQNCRTKLGVGGIMLWGYFSSVKRGKLEENLEAAKSLSLASRSNSSRRMTLQKRHHSPDLNAVEIESNLEKIIVHRAFPSNPTKLESSTDKDHGKWRTLKAHPNGQMFYWQAVLMCRHGYIYTIKYHIQAVLCNWKNERINIEMLQGSSIV